MGKKIHPTIFRMLTNKEWGSRWYADRKQVPGLLREDVRIKAFLLKRLRESFVSVIVFDRRPKALNITLHSARPGIIIGRGGTGVEDLKKEIKSKFLQGKNMDVQIDIKEVANPSLSARLLALDVVFAIEKRVPFRKAAKQVMAKAAKAGAKGMKIRLSGRLNGVEIARTEKFVFGNLPLSTIRANIEYAYEIAYTLYGTIGVKVWLYTGEVFKDIKNKESKDNK
ncbi:30S ribosomal protein S3 [Candidatus Falkowbacteria bacterium]|nr:30S ribosomal protein S3 [Candidatus Falkowbacteria bacterium]